MTAKNNLIACVLIGCSLLIFSHAQTPPKERVQTEIESVRLQVQNDGEKAYFLFSEGVVLRATNMYVECDSLEVFATREAEKQENIGKFGAIQKIVATGNVRIVQQERTATCQKAVVQPNEQRIVLSGSPVIEQPGGQFLTYNPGDEIILERGNGSIDVRTTGPKKLKLTSSAIDDLGFEQTAPVPSAEDEPEEESSDSPDDSKDDASQPNEKPDSE